MKKIFKALYYFFPFKKHLFRIFKKLINPSHSIYQHLYFHDVFTVQVTNDKKFDIRHHGTEIENELFWKGLYHGWESTSMLIWTKLCVDAEYIIDVGAKTGVYSLLAKTINNQAKVYAFEPVSRVFQKLKYNVALNHFNIKTYELAVSNNNGTAIIYDTPTDHILSVTVNKNLHPPEQKVIETQIQTVKLSSFIKKEKLPKIDSIKIDVETHEPEVLEGLGDYLQIFHPTMLIEVLNNEVGNKIEELVKDHGYYYFDIDEKNQIKVVDHIKKSSYFNYLLCQKATALTLNLLI